MLRRRGRGQGKQAQLLHGLEHEELRAQQERQALELAQAQVCAHTLPPPPPPPPPAQAAAAGSGTVP
jgi:hypothetical protein